MRRPFIIAMTKIIKGLDKFMLESNLNALMPFDFTGIRQRRPTIKEKTREKERLRMPFSAYSCHLKAFQRDICAN